MYEHHQRVIARLVEQFKADPACLGLIIGGSLARGWGRADSDIDVLILISEQDFQQRMETGNVLYFDRDICDYEGGYIDGKYIDTAYLRDAAERGIERLHGKPLAREELRHGGAHSLRTVDDQDAALGHLHSGRACRIGKPPCRPGRSPTRHGALRPPRENVAQGRGTG